MVPDDHALGPLEMRILGLLHPKDATSVHDIRAALTRSGDELAYTTVMTVLSRLYDKGLVVRVKDGRRYLYRLGKRAPGVTGRLVSRIQRALFPGDRAAPILALLEDDNLSAEDLRALRKRIDERLREKP